MAEARTPLAGGRRCNLRVAGPWQLRLIPWELRPPEPSLTVELTLVAQWQDDGWTYSDEPWNWDPAEQSAAGLPKPAESAMLQRPPPFPSMTPFKPCCDVVVDARLAVGRSVSAVGFGLQPAKPGQEFLQCAGDSALPDGHGLGFKPRPASWPAGRFDGNWRQREWPYMPRDFDWSELQLAEPGQRCPFLAGDEKFSLVGLRKDGRSWQGQLPDLMPRIVYRLAGEIYEATARLDTLIFRPETHGLCLQWRAVMEHPRRDFGRLDMLAVASQRRVDEALPALELLHAMEAAVEEQEPEASEDRVVSAPPPSAVDRAPETSEISLNDGEASKVVVKPDADKAMLVSLHQQLTQLLPGLALPGLLAGAAASSPPAPTSLPTQAAAEPNWSAAFGEEGGASFVRLVQPEPPAVDKAREEQQEEAAQSADVPLRTESAPSLTLGPGGNYSGVDWRGRNLRGVDLRGSQLAGARLDGADLSGANLSEADFSQASLSKALLIDANLQGARFSEANLAAADLSNSRAQGACFDGSDLSRASMHQAFIDEASFVGADLRRCDLSRSSAERACFRTALLERAHLFEANLSAANFDEAKMARTTADDAIATGASFCQSVVDTSSWRGAELSGANFSYASLQRVVLSGSLLVEANLTKADLSGGRLDGCNLKQAVFAGANLMQAHVTECDASGADFRAANLFRAATWRSLFSQAKFEGALLAGTGVDQA